MATLPTRDEAVAREWQTLSRKLSHARGFCFLVYFVRDQRLAGALKLRLRESLQARGGELVDIAADTPDALVAGSTAPLFRQGQHAADQAAQRVFWLEAFRGAGNAEWTAPREQLLMRLNERRSRLERELRAPLVLLLPAGEQRNAAMLAPDLWHIRIHSAALEAPVAAAAEPMQSRDEDGSSKSLPAVHSRADADEPREVAWWREQRALVAQHPAEAVDGQALKQVALWDGFKAIMVSIDSGRYGEAQGLVDEVMQLAMAQWEASAGDERPGAERLLAQARTLSGVLANAEGRFDVAVAETEQAVRHTRKAIAAQGTSSDDLASLVVQLHQLGNALQGLHRLDGAELAYEEALTHARWLVQQAGADEEALETLAVSLINVGEVHRMRGDWDQASVAFTESLQLIRTSLAANASVAGRRLLAVVLFKLGTGAAHQGRLDEAASAFNEALAADRARLADQRDSPQALDDVALDLEALAKLEGAAHDSTLAAAEEALQLRQRLVDLYPDVEPFQRALARVRQTFDNLRLNDQQPTP